MNSAGSDGPRNADTTTAPAAAEPPRTWDPEKFRLAFAGRRLISFDELYKYYRYDGVKSRITSLRYDPWDGVKIALVLMGLMVLIAACMTACHYREKSRRRRLSRQDVAADPDEEVEVELCRRTPCSEMKK